MFSMALRLKLTIFENYNLILNVIKYNIKQQKIVCCYDFKFVELMSQNLYSLITRSIFIR